MLMLCPDSGFSLAFFSLPPFSLPLGWCFPTYVGRLLQQNFRGGAGGNTLQQQPPPQQQVRAYPANNYGQFKYLLITMGSSVATLYNIVDCHRYW